MNQADILKLAQAAGFEHVFGDDYDHVGVFCGEDLRAGDFMTLNEYLTRFAELVAQHERDAAYKREQEIVRLACKAAADQARDHQKEIEAIRARSKS